mgnify:CR=1 FL=1
MHIVAPLELNIKSAFTAYKLSRYFKHQLVFSHRYTAIAYLFPSKEPFGIAPVEALAAGCPVIAYKEGGALDYIKDKENGLFFNEQTTNSLAAAIEEFLKLKEDKKSFPAKKISDSALPFDTEIFKAKMKEFIDEKIG